MTSQGRRAAGFTLIELMVVVAVIGLLAAIALTRFDGARQRARQSEARANMAGIYTSEQAYYAANNTYTNDFTQLGFTPGRGNRYAYYLDLPATTMQMRNVAKTTTVTGTDAISVDTATFPALAAAPTEFATDGVLTFGANPAGTVIPASSVTYFKTGSGGAFLARAYGVVNSAGSGAAPSSTAASSATYDAWFVSSNGASVTSSCTPVNGLKVPAGNPGCTYDQSACK